ncbi:hypothetical protein HYR99_12565 [Candidatus Poribacteria bacterium]|nr:hypothetical protein [Candidatus Poribacteria bacterium]
MNYPFPGNIRELKNIIEGALILSDRGEIRPEHLHLIEGRGEVTKPRLPTTDTTETSAESQQRQKRPPDREKLEALVVKRAQVRSSSEEKGTRTLPDDETDEEKILAYVREHGSINNAECRTLLNIDQQRANYLLRKLHRYGLLAPEVHWGITDYGQTSNEKAAHEPWAAFSFVRKSHLSPLTWSTPTISMSAWQFLVAQAALRYGRTTSRSSASPSHSSSPGPS